jgi:hypothetical protein
MLSFKKYITEATRPERMTTREQVLASVAQYKGEGEILNPVYSDLKDQVKRIFGKDTKVVKNVCLNASHVERKENGEDENLSALYYAIAWDSFAGLSSVEKIVAKIEKTPLNDNKRKAIAAAKSLLKDWKDIAEDIKDLKSKVVKVTTKRAEVKATAATAMQAKMNDSSSLIKVLESHLEEYKEMAKERATKFLDPYIKTLKTHGGDMSKIAPYPKSNIGVSEHKMAMAKRQVYQAISTPKSSSRKPNEPEIWAVDQRLVDHYINGAVKGAEASYRDFMHKMITKIGKTVVDASMTGNIWVNASLKVTCSDGEKQTWNTKMIINFSKYKTMFNQFPTRKAK